MGLELRKISFVQEFLRLENEKVIEGLEKLLCKSKADLYEKELTSMTETRLNTEIDRALQDSEDDKVINAKDLKTKVQQQWN